MLDQEFWEARYAEEQTGWDLGAVSPPLQAYFEGLQDRSQRILIPGCGRAYEAEYLWQQGFEQVHVLDWSERALADFARRVPGFPRAHLHAGDFFAHQGPYDLVVEQTFFCALDPALRARYVQKMHELLAPGGRLVGLLFNDPLNDDRPPFGGNESEYRALFSGAFILEQLQTAPDSIAPRAGRELFLVARKADLSDGMEP
jgi:SAM-dependent methyltransferase